MHDKEVIERFADYLEVAADRAMEMAQLQQIPQWRSIAKQLRILRENGLKMLRNRALSRAEALRILDKFQSKSVQ